MNTKKKERENKTAGEKKCWCVAELFLSKEKKARKNIINGDRAVAQGSLAFLLDFIIFYCHLQ